MRNVMRHIHSVGMVARCSEPNSRLRDVSVRVGGLIPNVIMLIRKAHP